MCLIRLHLAFCLDLFKRALLKLRLERVYELASVVLHHQVFNIVLVHAWIVAMQKLQQELIAQVLLSLPFLALLPLLLFLLVQPLLLFLLGVILFFLDPIVVVGLRKYN